METIQIGANIAKFRKQKGITQDELAGHFFVSSQAVSKWETGTACPESDILPDIADFFGVSIDSLFGRDAKICEDIDKSICTALNQCGYNNFSEGFRKALQYCWAIEKGLFSMAVDNQENHMDFSGSKVENVHTSSEVKTDEGFTYAVLRDELKYFLLMPEPAAGWLDILEYREEYRVEFEMLSKELMLKALLFSYSKGNSEGFTKKALANRLNIDEDSAAGMLSVLTVHGYLYENNIELDNEVQKYYTVIYKPHFIAIMAILNEKIFFGESFQLGSNGRSAPYLRKK